MYCVRKIKFMLGIIIFVRSYTNETFEDNCKKKGNKVVGSKKVLKSYCEKKISNTEMVTSFLLYSLFIWPYLPGKY